MTDDTLVEIYRAGDLGAASLLTHLLEEREIPAVSFDSGVDGIPRIQMGTVSHRIMVLRKDAVAHAREIDEAIRELEGRLGLRPSR